MFTRRTPLLRNAASSTSSLPASAPVCDAAALAAASVRPAATGPRIVSEMIDQIAPANVQHGSGGYKRAEANHLFEAPIKYRRAERSALADECHIARPGDAGGECGVEPRYRNHHSKTVWTDDAQIPAARLFHNLAFEVHALRADLLKPRCDDYGATYSGSHAVADHFRNDAVSRLPPDRLALECSR